MDAANRQRFVANEREYLDGWPTTSEQEQAVLDPDYNRLLILGGNIFFLSKVFLTDGRSFRNVAVLMSGMSEDYAAMMSSGGRSPAAPCPMVRVSHG